MIKPVRIKVECYSGLKAELYPKYFHWDNNKFEIYEIADRWYQGNKNPDFPASNYYKVETTLGQEFIIKHELDDDEWYLCQ